MVRPLFLLLRRGLLGAVAAGVLVPSVLEAHRLGEGYLFLSVTEERVEGRFEMTLVDLDRAVGLDADGDGVATPAEVEADWERAAGYLVPRLGLSAGGVEIPLEWGDPEFLRTWQGEFVAWRYRGEGYEAPPEVLDIRYEVLFDEDPVHRGFLIVETNVVTGEINLEEHISMLFEADEPVGRLALDQPIPKRGFPEFLWEGVWHIWIGIDHVLFLCALLLPSVLGRRDGRWQPLERFRPALMNVIAIVTLFTVAHSVTLALASLGIVRLPPRLVESVIALSVLMAALNNLWPVVHHHSRWIVFGFGLFHGFGFANVLAPLGMGAGSLAVSLLGFNVGVELGQLAIVAVVFPALFLLRGGGLLWRALFVGGSVVIAALAGVWLAQRSLGLG